MSARVGFSLCLCSHIGTRSHQRSLEPDNILGQRLDLLGKLFLVNLLAALLAQLGIAVPIEMFLDGSRVGEFGKNVGDDSGVKVEDGLLLVVFLLSEREWRGE